MLKRCPPFCYWSGPLITCTWHQISFDQWAGFHKALSLYPGNPMHCSPRVLPHLLSHMGPKVAQGVGLFFFFLVHSLVLNYFLIECVFWRSHSIKTFCWTSSYFWLFFFPFFSFVFHATIFYEVCEVMICWFCWCLVILSSTWSWWCLWSWDF